MRVSANPRVLCLWDGGAGVIDPQESNRNNYTQERCGTNVFYCPELTPSYGLNTGRAKTPGPALARGGLRVKLVRKHQERRVPGFGG